MPDTPITPPFAQQMAQATTYRVDMTGLVRIGVEGMQYNAPIRIAKDLSVVESGGGEVLWPGSAADMKGPFYFRTAAGGNCFVWAESRPTVTEIHHDPMGHLRAQVTWKPSYRDPVPGQWMCVTSNVQGMNGVLCRAEGHLIYVGTHVNTTLPPLAADPLSVGVPWPLQPTDPPLHIPGNPILYIWTDKAGARFWFAREQNAWGWV